jgi:hypothetical protein
MKRRREKLINEIIAKFKKIKGYENFTVFLLGLAVLSDKALTKFHKKYFN